MRCIDKRDVWKGGHRVPFIASWPRVIPTGSTSERDNVYCAQPELVSEIMAALAQLVGDNRGRSVDPPVPITE